MPTLSLSNSYVSRVLRVVLVHNFWRSTYFAPNRSESDRASLTFVPHLGIAEAHECLE